jgi:hypothetical protein
MKRIVITTLLLTFSTFAAAQVPRSNHVVLVVEENYSLSQVIGNPAMPYFQFPGFHIRAGHAVLCQRASIHRQLLHADDREPHHQQ